MTNYAHHIKGGGYLMVDHRASPGLPEEVARQAGYDPKLAGEGKMFEADTLTCAHCKCTVIKNPLRVRERAKCSKCSWHYICDMCSAAMLMPDYNHMPFEVLVEKSVKEVALGSPPKLLYPDESL